MNGVITLLAIVIAIAILALVPTLAAPYVQIYGAVTIFDCAKALLFCAAIAAITGFLIRRTETHGAYLLKLFLLALLLRIVIGTAIFVFNGQEFFGGDALTYDFFGYQQLLGWQGDKVAQSIADIFVGRGIGSGWGMVY